MALKQLDKALGKLFAAPPKRKPDPFRTQREQAKTVAKEHAIEIESLAGGGFNVWPPKSFTGEDPNDGDHYCSDWDDVFAMVQQYAGGSTTDSHKSGGPRP